MKVKSRKMFINLIYIIIAAVTVLIAIIIKNNNITKINDSSDNVMVKNKLNENISVDRVENFAKKYINEREILRKDNVVIVGENIKELENGFYDIKFELEDMNTQGKNRKLKIYINKLWKKYNEALYEDEYIEEIILILKEMFSINESLEELKSSIKDAYIKTKTTEENINNKTHELSGVTIDLQTINKEVILTINY